MILWAMETVLHLKYFNKLLTNKHQNHASVVGWLRRSVNPQITQVRIHTTPDFHIVQPSELSHSFSREWFTIFLLFFGKSREFLAMILWRGIRYVQSKMICVIIDKVVGDPKGKKKSSFQLSLFRCNYHMLQIHIFMNANTFNMNRVFPTLYRFKILFKKLIDYDVK